MIKEGEHIVVGQPKPWLMLLWQTVGSITAVWKEQTGLNWPEDGAAPAAAASFAPVAAEASITSARRALDESTAADLVYEELEWVGKVLIPEEGQALDKQYGPTRGATALRTIIPTWTADKPWSSVVDRVLEDFPDVDRRDFNEGDQRLLTTYMGGRVSAPAAGDAGGASGGESGHDSDRSRGSRGREDEEEGDEEEERQSNVPAAVPSDSTSTEDGGAGGK